jgi:hypothetical protein
VATVAKVWIPLAAELTLANAADNAGAPELLCRIPAEVRVVLELKPGADQPGLDPGSGREACPQATLRQRKGSPPTWR